MRIELQSNGHYHGLLKPKGPFEPAVTQDVQFCAYNEDVGEFTTAA